MVVKVCSICDDVRLEAVQNEIKILKKLEKSVHVANLVEEFIDNDNNKAYLVLERAGDLSLEQLVEESHQGLTLEQIKTITKQLCQAVGKLYDNLIVHRDIKPDNIMLSQSDLVLKLIDFNIAHDLALCSEIKGFCGVRAWSAPETRSF